MTIAQMEQFQAVCRAGSVSKAAEQLHISQPSVSNSIRELEDEFRVNLFVRANRRLHLTKEGDFFLAQVNQILAKTTQLSEQMHDIGKNKNHFRIGVPPMSGSTLFPGLFKAFRAAYPEIAMEIIETGSLASGRMIEEDTLDIAMATVNEPPGEQFRTLKLCSSELVFCVSPKHRLAGRHEVKLSELSGEPLILFQEDSCPMRAVMQEFAAAGITPNILLRSNQLNLIREFIEDGIAGAFLLREIAERDPGMLGIPLAHPIPIDVILMWKRSKYMYSDVATFLTFAREHPITTLQNKINN